LLREENQAERKKRNIIISIKKEREREREKEHPLGIFAPASIFDCFRKVVRSNTEITT